MSGREREGERKKKSLLTNFRKLWNETSSAISIRKSFQQLLL